MNDHSRVQPPSFLGTYSAGFQSIFLPNLGKPLALAVIVAENVDCIILAQPAMELFEEFLPLGLGYLGIRSPAGQRAERFQALKVCPLLQRRADVDRDRLAVRLRDGFIRNLVRLRNDRGLS